MASSALGGFQVFNLFATQSSFLWWVCCLLSTDQLRLVQCRVRCSGPWVHTQSAGKSIYKKASAGLEGAVGLLQAALAAAGSAAAAELAGGQQQGASPPGG